MSGSIVIESFTTKYVKGRKAVVRPNTYGANGTLALQVFDAVDGDPLVTATVNPVGGPVPKGMVAIKNWSENEGVEQAFIDAEIINAKPYAQLSQGYVTINVYRLTQKARDAFGV